MSVIDPADPSARLRVILERVEEMAKWVERNRARASVGIVNPSDPPPTLPFPIPITQPQLADEALAFWLDLLDITISISDALVASARAAGGQVEKT